ncbi:MAG TPA: hypothetical protein VMT52_10590 [Planctomycetota bacterium]|nr:hypothetical protein [Planctomycetota bacterium]
MSVRHLLLILLLCAAGSGCSTSGAAGGQGPFPGPRDLVRCAYRVGDSVHYLDVGPSDSEVSTEALRAVLDGRRDRDASPGDGGIRFERALELGSGLILEELENGGVGLRLYWDLSGFESSDSTILPDLRRLSLEALLDAMWIRRPLAWHHAALAAFVKLDGLPRPVSASWFRGHLENAPNPRPVVMVLLPGVFRFGEEKFEGFLESDDIALRLLALASAASRGDRKALTEIFTLSLEYHGEALLFEAAVRPLFPAALDPEPARPRPVTGDPAAAAAFVRELHARLGDASWRPGEGWVLAGRRDDDSSGAR